MSVHTGTHADAPLHITDNGLAIDELPVEHFIGPATVVEIAEGVAITPGDLPASSRSTRQRVLFKTPYSYVQDNEWEGEWLPLLPETVEILADSGTSLIGTDAPSVDPPESETLDTHQTIADYGMVHLELLHLENVPEGEYTLIALPLKLKGVDASPVRALLLHRL